MCAGPACACQQGAKQGARRPMHASGQLCRRQPFPPSDLASPGHPSKLRAPRRLCCPSSLRALLPQAATPLARRPSGRRRRRQRPLRPALHATPSRRLGRPTHAACRAARATACCLGWRRRMLRLWRLSRGRAGGPASAGVFACCCTSCLVVAGCVVVGGCAGCLIAAQQGRVLHSPAAGDPGRWVKLLVKAAAAQLLAGVGQQQVTQLLHAGGTEVGGQGQQHAGCGCTRCNCIGRAVKGCPARQQGGVRRRHGVSHSQAVGGQHLG
jgi:hypothetical protein